MRDRFALDADLAAGQRVDAAEHARQRAAAAAEQAGHADDLAAADREVDVARPLAPETPRSSTSGSPTLAVLPLEVGKPRERRPTMCSIIDSSVNSDIGAVMTCFPSRRIVARSAIWKISSIRCET